MPLWQVSDARWREIQGCALQMFYAPGSVRLPKEDLRIGKYQVLQRLASGGMGEVFLALQEGPAGFLRKVVIKRMRVRIGEDPAFVEMFLNEARLAALLSHPNVVHILELGQTEDGSWFIAMEHIHGRSLREVLLARSQRGTPGLPSELAARLCADVLRGLHHAHEMRDTQGKWLEIIHRDISPENVLVSFSGMVKVVDFGIAKAMSESSSMTHVSQLKGKVPYLAPEQLRSERADARTDVYATGCVLYEMLSGRSPFPSRPDADLMEEVLTSMPIPLGTLSPSLPEALGAITLKAMARSPADRFASAQEMATALEDFLLQTQAHVPPEEVGRFLAGLLGEEAAALGVPRVDRHQTVSLASMARPSLTEPLTEPLSLPQELPLSLISESSPPDPLGAPPSGELRHDTSGMPTEVVEAPTAALSAEAVTEEAVIPEHEPKPARVEHPVERAPVQLPARRWPVPLVAAALGLLLTLFVAGFLQPGLEPPVAVSPEEPEQADTEPEPEIPPPPAGEAPLVRRQAVPQPPRRATVRSSSSKDKKARHSRKGRVVLHVQPAAEIFIGSRRLGVASMEPTEIELPAGQHTLTLKNAELGVMRRITVKVPAGGKVAIKEDLGLLMSQQP